MLRGSFDGVAIYSYGTSLLPFKILSNATKEATAVSSLSGWLRFAFLRPCETLPPTNDYAPQGEVDFKRDPHLMRP